MIRHNFLTNQATAQQFIDGIKILKDPARSPWPGQSSLSLYDALVFWHHQSMMLMTPPGQTDRNAAHSGPAFLPWHRYFLITLEQFLRQALNDDNFRVPYWDWSADAEMPNPNTSLVWEQSNLGQFVGSEWRVRLAMNPVTGNLRSVNRRLRRNLGANGSLPTRDQIRRIHRDQSAYDQEPFNSSSSGGVRNYIEGWIGAARVHNSVHIWIGGDMSLSSSPNDPVFFLHHCNVDRLWAAWQEKGLTPSYLPDMTAPDTLQFHRIDDALYSLFEETVTPRQMIDYRAYYEYDALDDLSGP